MKICYFGHPAHEWSGSSKFFEEILSSLGSMVIYRPSSLNVDDVIRVGIESDFDLYVFFQFDFLAYPFIAAGKRVLVVPMVDGSASYGSEHWQKLRGSRFVSFSKNLDEFLKIGGHDSLHTQFWPEPKEESSAENMSAYYWPRGNHEYVSTQKIVSLFKNYPEIKIKVRASDSPESELDYSRVHSDNIEIIRINSRIEHLEEIQKSAIFIAPRPSEGIGHSFIEPLTFGRCVVARKYPTMSEYISNRDNGLLFNAKTKPINQGIDWIQLGKNAYSRAIKGHESYLQSLEGLSNFILTTKASTRRVRVSEVHELLDISSSILKGLYFPKGKLYTLQNWIRVKNFR